MYQVMTSPDNEKNLARMVSAVGHALEDEADPIAAMANTSAFIMAYMGRLNWAGFYLMRRGQLVLGPFQGMPACTRIAVGAGVCGAAAAGRRNMLVADVEAFPGHIACDSASRSELVVPFYMGGQVAGVIDLDSPEKNRFTALEEKYIDQIARLVEAHLARSGWRVE